MVTNPIVHYMADLIKCKDLARELNVKSLGVVVNMVRNKGYELTPKEINQLVDTVISTIPYDEKVMESIIFKIPAVHTNAKVKKHFHELAEYLVGDYYQQGSFFSRLLRFLRLT
jgi:CO dehydrogenase nickel-insertion accessory protein CooC1